MATAARREIAAGELLRYEMQLAEMNKNEVKLMDRLFSVAPMMDWNEGSGFSIGQNPVCSPVNRMESDWVVNSVLFAELWEGERLRKS